MGRRVTVLTTSPPRGALRHLIGEMEKQVAGAPPSRLQLTALAAPLLERGRAQLD
jgi:hypothetical protein